SGDANRQRQTAGGSVGTGPTGSLVTTSGGGAHTLKTQVVDNAGNVSGWRTSTVTVDLSLSNDHTPPIDTTAPPSGWQGGATDVTVTATEGLTGGSAGQFRPAAQLAPEAAARSARC